MIELLPMVLSLVAGLGLGYFYFGGLWLTVERLPVTRYPTLLTLGSYLGRTAVTLIGFYFVMGNGMARLLVGLLGFVVVRTVLVRHWSPRRKPSAEDGGRSCS